MGKVGVAILSLAGLLWVGISVEAVAAPNSVPQASAATDISAQARRRARTRIVVYPRGIYPPLVGPRHFGFSQFPRPYPYDWPGPGAKRDCAFWLAAEARPSGTVVVPRERCWWILP